MWICSPLYWATVLYFAFDYLWHTHRHTHFHLCVCVCACVRACVCVLASVCLFDSGSTANRCTAFVLSFSYYSLCKGQTLRCNRFPFLVSIRLGTSQIWELMSQMLLAHLSRPGLGQQAWPGSGQSQPFIYWGAGLIGWQRSSLWERGWGLFINNPNGPR